MQQNGRTGALTVVNVILSLKRIHNVRSEPQCTNREHLTYKRLVYCKFIFNESPIKCTDFLYHGISILVSVFVCMTHDKLLQTFLLKTYITYGKLQSHILFAGYHSSSPKQVFYAMTFHGMTISP